MKKALVILSIIAAAMSLTSCHIEGATIRTEDYTIEPGAWLTSDGSTTDRYLYVTCEADFITKSVCEDGAVNAYLWLPGTKTWTPLPYVTLYSSNQGGMGSTIVAENIRFEYAPGEITFIAQDMNGQLPAPMVDVFTFRVTSTK